MARRIFCLNLLLPEFVAQVSAQGPNSCQGKCGSWADTCYCNDQCTARGNCCSDYKKTCPAPAPGGSCPKTAKCSGYSCDDWIAYKPTYTCNELEKEFGCDCTGCKCTKPKPSHNAADLVMLNETQFSDAKCLDGSMAGYYLRKGSANKYLIFFEGGGWCYDQNGKNPTRQGTLGDCHSRATGRLGSSKSWTATQDSYLTDITSADSTSNPVFHNWTLAYVPYCDGMSFSGNSVVDGLYFKGQAIRDAIISQLKESTGIQGAEQVVISGGSAGASAVLWHSDAIAEKLQLTSGEVLGLPDAGFFLDVKDKDKVDRWPNQMRSLFEVAGGYDTLHSGCLARFPNEKWKCMFPEYFSDIIKTRTMLMQSLYDSSEISYSLGLDCCEGAGYCRSGTPKCTQAELELILTLRGAHEKGWAPLVQKPGNGVWSPSCIIHTMSWGKWTDTTWEVPASSGNTMAKVVQQWLTGNANNTYQDPVAWPNNKPCASSSVLSAAAESAAAEAAQAEKSTLLI